MEVDSSDDEDTYIEDTEEVKEETEIEEDSSELILTSLLEFEEEDPSEGPLPSQSSETGGGEE